MACRKEEGRGWEKDAEEQHKIITKALRGKKKIRRRATKKKDKKNEIIKLVNAERI